MTFAYHFGGIELRSSIAFKRLRPYSPGAKVRARMDILLCCNAAPQEDKNRFSRPGRFRMRLGWAHGAWRVEVPEGVFIFDEHAESITIHMSADQPAIVKDMFVRRLLPRLAKLKGASLYHAASLAAGRHGILIFGQSGAGKSSMSVALAQTGRWAILGDDLAVVWPGEPETVAAAGADVTIWPMTSEGLGLPESSLDRLAGYDGKLAFHSQSGLVHCSVADSQLPEQSCRSALKHSWERLERPKLVRKGTLIYLAFRGRRDDFESRKRHLNNALAGICGPFASSLHDLNFLNI